VRVWCHCAASGSHQRSNSSPQYKTRTGRPLQLLGIPNLTGLKVSALTRRTIFEKSSDVQLLLSLLALTGCPRLAAEF
jgi:hypothetical protein